MSGYKRWTAEEEQMLVELVGDIPRCRIHCAFNGWASSHGYPSRTRRALLYRAQRLKLSARAVGTWLTAQVIADTLEIPVSTVHSWQRQPDFPQKRVDPRVSISYIHRPALRAWAAKHPHRFGGLPRGPLVMLLEDEKLVDSILERFPLRPRANAVRCVETGRTWPSAAAAARDLHVTRNAVDHALRQQRPVAGRLLVRVSPSSRP